MRLALDQFVKSLEDSGIISPANLDDAREKLPPANRNDPQALARELVRQKKLTRYQAQEVYLGNASSLVLGNYVIQDKIGEGGMGQVYRAEHRRMERVVAVKMLPTSVTVNEAAVARFAREVKAAARLNHPNIVAAYDADQAKGVHFLVMEYVDGSDLAAVVKKHGPLSLTLALDCALQAARGLEYAHKKGVIHRDIKPGNLLLDREGTVKILDMGLARLESSLDSDTVSSAELTSSGMIMGTVDFMAPEQALNIKAADARADIYSLGCTLFYLLTGTTVYQADSPLRRLLAHRDKPVPSLCERRADVPEEVDALFRRMVAKRVEDRYQSMSEVVADLERCSPGREAASGIPFDSLLTPDSELLTFLRDGPVQPSSRPQPPSRPAWTELAKSHKELLVVAGAVALFVLVTAAGVVLSGKMAGKAFLVLTVNKSDAEVRILNARGKVELRGRTTSEPFTGTVAPGEYLIEVKKEGYIPFSEKLAVGSSERKRLSVTLHPSDFPDRRAADWVLGRGGELRIVGSDALITDPKQLPRGPFQISELPELWKVGPVNDRDLSYLRGLSLTSVMISDAQNVTDDGLKVFGDMPNLTVCSLFNAVDITDLGLRILARYTGLNQLRLGGAKKITDAGLRHLTSLKRLGRLSLGDCHGVSIRGLESLHSLPITYLEIGGTAIVGPDLAELRCFSALGTIDLRGTGLSDDDLEHLAQLATVHTLYLDGRRLTDDGLKHLSRMEALANLHLDSGTVSGAALGTFAGAKLRWLTIAGTLLDDDGLRALSGVSRLEWLHLCCNRATDDGLRHLQSLPALSYLMCERIPVTDAGLSHLAKCAALKKVELRQTNVTASGVAALQKSLPDCTIDWDKQPFPPQPASPAVAAANRRMAEWILTGGGTVTVAQNGARKTVDVGGMLPDAPFEVVEARLPQAKLITERLLRLPATRGVWRQYETVTTPAVSEKLDSVSVVEIESILGGLFEKTTRLVPWGVPEYLHVATFVQVTTYDPEGLVYRTWRCDADGGVVEFIGSLRDGGRSLVWTSVNQAATSTTTERTIDPDNAESRTVKEDPSGKIVEERNVTLRRLRSAEGRSVERPTFEF